MQVFNKRKDHKSQVSISGVRVHFIEVSVEYRYFLQLSWRGGGGGEMGLACAAVRSIWGPLYTGLTV